MFLFILLLLLKDFYACKSEEFTDEKRHHFIQSKTFLNRYSPFSEFIPRHLQLRGFDQKCNANDLRKIQNLLKDDTCKPRLTLIEIKVNETNVVKVLPHNVFLQRCLGGATSKQHGCIPTKTKEIEIPVAKLHVNSEHGNFEPECSDVKMIEHISCAIGCKQRADDCNEKQVFIESQCRCQCFNHTEMLECERAGKMWIDGMCACECLPSSKVDCSTGFVFDNQHCKCIRNGKVEANENYINLYLRTLHNKENKNS